MKWIVLLVVFVCWCSAGESRDAAVDLYYQCFSDRDTNIKLPPIFLLHGLGADTKSWNNIYETLALKTKRKVCMCDARNHGVSPKTEEFSFDLMAADTVKLMDTLNVTKALLLGQSMGGKTASVTALKYAMGQSMAEKLTQHMLFLLICDSGKCRFRMDMDFVWKVIEDPECLTKVYDGRYDGDALFVYGTLSPFKIGEAEEEIRPLFPKAQLVPIDGAGHGPSHEKPDEYFSAVTSFINGDGFCKMPD